jgi:hypothetical protein
LISLSNKFLVYKGLSFMTVKADPAQLHYLQQINHPLPQSTEPIRPLQRRALSAIAITLVLLILTYILDVLSVRAAIASSTALPSSEFLNFISTLVTLLTTLAGIGAAITFVSYRAKVLHCGSPTANPKSGV